MLLKKPCSACGEIHEIDGISRDNIGWHTTCKKTNSTFDVDITDYVVPNETMVKVFNSDVSSLSGNWIGWVMGNDLIVTDEIKDLLYFIYNKKGKCRELCFREDFEIINIKGE